MNYAPALIIPQGTTRLITVTNIVDSAGAPLSVSGWAVHATIRAPGIGSAVVGEWSTTPTGTQGTATTTGSTITILIPAAMSTAWTWSRGVLQAELTEPGINGRTERIIDQPVRLTPEVVTT